MRSSLDHLPVMQHEYLVCRDYCREAMGDRDRRPPLHQDCQRPLDLRLDLAVDGARRLVQQEQRRVGGDRPREGQKLPLADADR